VSSEWEKGQLDAIFSSLKTLKYKKKLEILEKKEAGLFIHIGEHELGLDRCE